MLRGIAIYKVDETKPYLAFQKTDQYVPKANPFNFFTNDTFDEIEKFTLSVVTQEEFDKCKIIDLRPNKEFHYLIRIPHKPLIVAICSRTEIDPKVLMNIFLNCFATQHQSSNVTIDMIFANPLGFYHVDKGVEHILNELGIIIELMITNMHKMYDREDKIKSIFDKSIVLLDASKQFEEEAAKRNRYCSYCRYS